MKNLESRSERGWGQSLLNFGIGLCLVVFGAEVLLNGLACPPELAVSDAAAGFSASVGGVLAA